MSSCASRFVTTVTARKGDGYNCGAKVDAAADCFTWNGGVALWTGGLRGRFGELVLCRRVVDDDGAFAIGEGVGVAGGAGGELVGGGSFHAEQGAGLVDQFLSALQPVE